MRRRTWFTVAVALQLAVLLIMIATKWSTLAFGTKIMLKTQPVDPWDMFRGDYVTLNYEISNLDLSKVDVTKEQTSEDRPGFSPNQTVYIVLQKQGKYWTAKSLHEEQPPGGSLSIKGTVRYYFEAENQLFVDYGLDSYYVPEKEGRKLEGSREPFDVEVSVDSRGNSALSRLFMQGKEIEFQ